MRAENITALKINHASNVSFRLPNGQTAGHVFDISSS